jgi:hypothetical protein
MLLMASTFRFSPRANTRQNCLVFQYSGPAARREAPRPGKYNRGTGAAASIQCQIPGGLRMNPLDSITGTLVSGLVLAIILTFVIKAIVGG